jgi:hypothetical protein
VYLIFSTAKDPHQLTFLSFVQIDIKVSENVCVQMGLWELGQSKTCLHANNPKQDSVNSIASS